MADRIIILSVILIKLFHQISGQTSFLDPDVYRQTNEFIESRGFIPEFHSIFTNDGYQISMHQIVHPYKKATRRPVLFISSDGGSGLEWLRNSPGGSVNESTNFVGPNIGFECAKRGYDVWLLNFRGRPEDSYLHTTYDADHDLAYWDYSQDELAFFDVAAAIDYVRNMTRHKKIGVVALAGGTTAYFFLASKVPRFNHIVRPFIALSPTFSRVHNDYVRIRGRTIVQDQVDFFKLRRGQRAPTPLVRIAQAFTCRDKITQSLICNPILYLLSDSYFDGKIGSVNYDRLSVYVSTGFSLAASSWQGAQTLAAYLSERVTMLDVSPEINLQRYGRVKPPEYRPERISNPDMHFILHENNEDYANLKKRLGTRVRPGMVIPIPWSMMSYQDGKPDDVIKWVNSPVLNILAQYG